MALAMLVSSAARAETCAPPPLPIVDLDIIRFYGDAKGSIIDPKLQAKHDAATTPLTAFLRTVTSNADKAWTRTSDKSRNEAARCALDWIAAWAKGNAWLGRMAQNQAEYQRKWDLAGLALAYIKVRRFASADERRIIEPYLMRFADAARAFFDDPARTRNNHWYWLGLAVGAVAVATDSERHWQIGARDHGRRSARYRRRWYADEGIGTPGPRAALSRVCGRCLWSRWRNWRRGAARISMRSAMARCIASWR